MAALYPSLTEAHRQFAQALLALGAVEAGVARGILRRCCERHRVHCAPERLDEFVAALNARLQPLSMEIRKGLAEEDGRAFYAMVNLAENEVTKLASDYSESELELFKKTLDLILSSESGFAPSTAILNLADQVKPKKMRKTEAEQVLQSLVQGKWLQEREGEYTLTVRSILELEQYILSHYPESARKCHICHSLSIQSQVCGDCGTAMHLPCLAKYFHGQAEPRCPHCKQFWPQQLPGERACFLPLSVSFLSLPPPCSWLHPHLLTGLGLEQGLGRQCFLFRQRTCLGKAAEGGL
ncbi:non-structural maintenance of chromosomes element 1 homolog [Sceloporus undulatus]|uniref:non-structural maintenance of chromosomes element 1 homolog n=1 Tax=Sceloporus undulatus TaxID=8520 RepID=UPI001C4CD460|nr:non-structural maintenance of chromosomes element 1 homolog [Sceloporus undulatus]